MYFPIKYTVGNKQQQQQQLGLNTRLRNHRPEVLQSPLIATPLSMSSKYGSLRDEQAGPCRTFLKRTAKYHDCTMEHPLMQSIYDKKITDSAYVLYLQGMYELFAMLETPDALTVLPASLVDSRLNRMTAIEQDLKGLGAHTDPEVRRSSSAMRRYFAELLQPDQLQNSNQMICHHFLHYNAMLSGGMILGACLRQMSKPTALYGFQLQDPNGKTVPCHQYVRDYMQRLDKCVVSAEDLEPMVQTMVQIYELTEELMNEAQALQPTVVRPVTEKRVIAPTPEAFVPRITFEQLRASDGTNGSKLWLSIGGRVLDAYRCLWTRVASECEVSSTRPPIIRTWWSVPLICRSRHQPSVV